MSIIHQFHTRFEFIWSGLIKFIRIVPITQWIENFWFYKLWAKRERERGISNSFSLYAYASIQHLHIVEQFEIEL